MRSALIIILEEQQNSVEAFFSASPRESYYKKLTQDRTTLCVKRKLKCHERGSCLLESKDVYKYSSRCQMPKI